MTTRKQNKIDGEMPEYNSFQLKILIHALESLDISNYDTGYKETHKYLLAKLKDK